MTKKNQELLPLVSLAKNGQEKTNFHCWYPWSKIIKKQNFTVGNLGEVWPRKTKTFTFGNFGQK